MVIVVTALAVLRRIALVVAFVFLIVVAGPRALSDWHAVDVDVVEHCQPEPQLGMPGESGALVEHDLETLDRTRYGHGDERRVESHKRRRSSPGQTDKAVTRLLRVRRW